MAGLDIIQILSQASGYHRVAEEDHQEEEEGAPAIPEANHGSSKEDPNQVAALSVSARSKQRKNGSEVVLYQLTRDSLRQLQRQMLRDLRPVTFQCLPLPPHLARRASYLCVARPALFLTVKMSLFRLAH